MKGLLGPDLPKMANSEDVPDYSAFYNTQLEPDKEAEFQKWLKEQSALKGYDMNEEMQDYDLRGAYADAATPDERGHLTDKFKKPNHPTFSTGSIYHGALPGLLGGVWTPRPADPMRPQITGEAYNYTASPTNLAFRTKNRMLNYFNRTEPDSRVSFPEEAAPLGMRR